jgi:hypothetical protein
MLEPQRFHEATSASRCSYVALNLQTTALVARKKSFRSSEELGSTLQAAAQNRSKVARGKAAGTLMQNLS